MSHQVGLPHAVVLHKAEQHALLSCEESQFVEFGLRQRALCSTNVREQNTDVFVVFSHNHPNFVCRLNNIMLGAVVKILVFVLRNLELVTTDVEARFSAGIGDR